MAISVDSTISLLEHHQRPRNVEMNQTMTQVVKIQAFRCNIRCNQNTNRRFRSAKILNNALLFSVAHPTGNLLNGVCLQSKVLAKSFGKILHGFDTLSKDNNTVTAICWIPSVFFTFEEIKEFLIACKICRSNCLQRSFQVFKQVNIFDVICGIFFI